RYISHESIQLLVRPAWPERSSKRPPYVNINFGNLLLSAALLTSESGYCSFSGQETLPGTNDPPNKRVCPPSCPQDDEQEPRKTGLTGNRVE
ncbi:MAG: hypothetical protein ABSG68_26075, partial [Thermoguttaceae bacterium]